MAYTFKVSASTRRYRAYRTHRSLATAPVVILFTFCFLAASIVTFLQYFGLIATTDRESLASKYTASSIVVSSLWRSLRLAPAHSAGTCDFQYESVTMEIF